MLTSTILVILAKVSLFSMEIAQFIDYLHYEKRYSEHTLLSYRNDLEQFLQHCRELENESFSLLQAQPQQIRLWLAGLLEKGISSRSIHRKISSLRSYYKYCQQLGALTSNPVLRVTMPKVARRLPVFVPEAQTKTLFDELEFTEDFAGLRDRLILEMFYATGIRLAELVQLLHSDIDLAQGQLRVKGKGNKQRVVPMVDTLVSTCKLYLKQKLLVFENNTTDYLFVTDKGKKIYRRFVYRVVNFYLSTYTSAGKRSPHILRHTFATHMLNQGADINAIKELLGHSSLSATQVYTHTTVEKLKSVYKQAHPKA